MTLRPDRIERQVCRALLAFPWRDRAERCEEIVGTVLDALPPDADRLPLPTALDLVRGGLRIRRQRRPPFLVRWSYRHGQRVHPRWVPWVLDVLDDPHHVEKRVVRRLAWTSVVLALVLWTLPTWSSMFVIATLSVGACAWLALLVAIPRERAEARRRHGLMAGGRDPRLVWVRRAHGRPGPQVVAALMSGATAAALLLVAAAMLTVGDSFLVVVGAVWGTISAGLSCASAWSNRGGAEVGASGPASAGGLTAELDVIDAAWAAGFEVVAPPVGLRSEGTDGHTSPTTD